MLVLCSNGLSSQSLLDAVRAHIGKAKKAALVVTADNEYKAEDYHVPKCTEELESLGLVVSCFDIDVQPAEELLQYDVVEFIGGNPFYLLNSLREHNCKEILQEIAAKKLLIGWSGGALPMTRSLELVNMYIPEQNFLKLVDLTGLNLTDVVILPHYKKFVKRYERFEEKCCEYEQKYKVNVLRIDDGDGVLIDELVSVIRQSESNA